MNAAESEREQIGFKRPSFINVVPTAEVFRGVRLQKFDFPASGNVQHLPDRLLVVGSAEKGIDDVPNLGEVTRHFAGDRQRLPLLGPEHKTGNDVAMLTGHFARGRTN